MIDGYITECINELKKKITTDKQIICTDGDVYGLYYFNKYFYNKKKHIPILELNLNIKDMCDLIKIDKKIDGIPFDILKFLILIIYLKQKYYTLKGHNHSIDNVIAVFNTNI